MEMIIKNVKLEELNGRLNCFLVNTQMLKMILQNTDVCNKTKNYERQLDEKLKE